MRLLPFIRETETLGEQIQIVKDNYPAGVIIYLLTTAVAFLILDFTQYHGYSYYWLSANIVTSIFILARHYWHEVFPISPISNARWLVFSQMLLGSLWGFLSFLVYYEPYANILIFLGLGVLIMSATMNKQAPYLPIFMSFLVTSYLPLIIALIMRGNLIAFGLGIASCIYFYAISSIAKNYQKSLKSAIELRRNNFRLAEDLNATMNELQDAVHAKSIFLASASHDLRQPLHAIGLFCETLKNTKLSDSQQDIVARIDESTTQTRDLLGAILDYSRLDSAFIEPVIDNFSLQPLLDKLEDELGGNAAMHNLDYRSRDTLLAVETDKVLLEIILRNIISNAINYTSDGGILIGCRKRRDVVVIEVWDTGIGIDPVDLSNIFKEFHQLNNSQRNREKGFGLGLAIVKGLIDRLNLDIEVSSTRGKGSLFRITVPLSTSRIREEIIIDEITGNFDGLQILLIDDDESIRISMGGLLKSWGIDCQAAESSNEAIDLVFKYNFIPDLIISDYRLRDNLNGRQALNDVRGTTFDTIPAIMITGDTDPLRFMDATAANALLIHKPISASQLRTTLTTLLC
jgi:signal transduction histidine kinase/CheY-like chemotaxis protein|tara:strand:+ start:6472 stop:8193 length:1722 start_codon:yes stop_codon:yes gene_type:complete